jgi:hypothetical protein
VSHPRWSPDNSKLALAGEGGHGLFVYDVNDQTLVRLAEAPGSGAWCHWSPDGAGLGFKLFEPAESNDFPPQVSAVYRTDSGVVEPLGSAARRAGCLRFRTPAASRATLGNEVWIDDGAETWSRATTWGTTSIWRAFRPMAAKSPTTARTNKSGCWTWIRAIGTA